VNGGPNKKQLGDAKGISRGCLQSPGYKVELTAKEAARHFLYVRSNLSILEFQRIA